MTSIITENFIMDYYETLNLNERYSLIQKLMNINDNDNKSAASAIIEEKPKPQLKPEIEDIVEEKKEELSTDDKKINNLKIGAIHKYYILLSAIKQLIKKYDDEKIRIIKVDNDRITFLDDNSMINSIRMDNNNGYIIKYYNETIINAFIILWRIELKHLLEFNSPIINGIQYANIYLFSCDDNIKLLQKMNIKYGILHDNQKIRLSNMMAIYNKANNNEECDDLINSYNIKIKNYQEYIKVNIKYRIKPTAECPVCLEQTYCNIGNCNHPLCKDCYKKIQFDNLSMYKRCPLCRQDIICIKNCQVEKI